MHAPKQKRITGSSNKLRNFTRRPSRRSSALIITLVALSMLVLLSIALAFVVRVDRLSARYFLEDSRAALFSDQGVNQAVALLRTLSGNTNTYWVVQPGQGYVASGANAASNLTNQAPTNSIPLNSGLGTAYDSSLGVINDPDLNAPSFEYPDIYPVNSTNQSLNVRWIYVDQKGDCTTNRPTPPYDQSNPIVGRYAFWVDNENSRINLNTAHTRDNSGSSSISPDNIDLRALTNISPTDPDTIHNYVTAHLLNSPDDARLMNPGIASIINTNEFSTTYYNHDPETTYWGAPKIVLTTNKSLARGRPFLDILKTENTTVPGTVDPGLLDNLDTSSGLDPSKGLTKTIYMLMSYLGHPDWPVGVSGQSPWPVAPLSNPTASFSTKFFGTTQQSHQLMQLAIQIIDYVRAKESKSQIIEKISGTIGTIGTTDYYYHNYNDSGVDVISQSRQVCINEMGIWLSPTPSSIVGTGPFANAHFSGTFKVELYLPPHYGLTSYDVSQLMLNYVWDFSWYDPNWNATTSLNASNVTVGGLPTTTLPAGGYATVSVPFDYFNTSFPSTNRPSTLYVKSTIAPAYAGGDLTKMIDSAPLITHYFYPNTGIVPYTLDPTNVPPENITSMEVDDPRINKDWQDWHRHNPAGTATKAGNTFGTQNSIYKSGLTTSPAPYPEQDTDTSGSPTDASLYMPPPAGQAGNLDGMVHSVAELGYVLTGCAGEGIAGVPWRTFHFQPMSQPGIGANAYLPDWAVMDLFEAPQNPNAVNTSTAFASNPIISTNAIAGRINLNSAIAPFESGSPSLGRTGPLTALLLNNTSYGGDPATAAQLASNIYNHTLATHGQRYLGASMLADTYGSGIYSMPGELAEIQGIADGGETSETKLQSIVDLATTRSNVFRIYSIGQAIQQAKNNTLTVTGEHRDCTFVERYPNPDPNNPGGVSFHVVYHRSITF